MDVEKTIEFILRQEAKAEARLQKAMERMDRADKRMDRADKRADRADKRLDRLERVVAQTNRVVMGLVRYGVSLRSDVRRHDKAILRIEAAVANLAESQQRTDDRLNALIRLVDRTDPEKWQILVPFRTTALESDNLLVSLPRIAGFPL